MRSLGFVFNFFTGGTIALGSTQPLTEMSTWDISWGKKAVGV